MTHTDINVADIMTDNILVAHKGLAFSEICRLFFEMHFHHLPVLDEDEQLVGIISSNDLLQVLSRKMLIHDELSTEELDEHVGLEELMTKDPTCSSNSSVLNSS